MSESKKAAPIKHAADVKQARLATALRENLKRRKAQARAKADNLQDNSQKSKEN